MVNLVKFNTPAVEPKKLRIVYNIIIGQNINTLTRTPYLMRMHLIGEPSAPSNLSGKQWTEYSPGLTSSNFRPSTRMISYIISKECLRTERGTFCYICLNINQKNVNDAEERTFI